jgi:hypothetical protein
LEVPFSPNRVQWRVTNTAKDRKRGQVVPYADPRAYADWLNALFTPQQWTREYRVETLSNITRIKGGESIVTGKILVTCTVTIIGLWSHSGTGEEWADDSNAMTAADAQAFKRACSCFGLGRYLYEFHGSWVDLDQNQQPKRMPAHPGLGDSRELAEWDPPSGNGHSGPKSNGRKQGPLSNSADELEITYLPSRGDETRTNQSIALRKRRTAVRSKPIPNPAMASICGQRYPCQRLSNRSPAAQSGNTVTDSRK